MEWQLDLGQSTDNELLRIKTEEKASSPGRHLMENQSSAINFSRASHAISEDRSTQ
jgi:hypothetical protein